MLLPLLLALIVGVLVYLAGLALIWAVVIGIVVLIAVAAGSPYFHRGV